MTARDDYPKLAFAHSGPHHQGQTSQECHAALDEIDRLRGEVGRLQRMLLVAQGVIPDEAEPETCPARIAPFPEPTTVIDCEHDAGHAGAHEGVLRDYAYPGSRTTISWLPDDRRSFTGDWSACTATAGCILPAGHPRRCAP